MWSYFSSISEAIHEYPALIEKYLGSIVPIGDNYFSALNSAVLDGSFLYQKITLSFRLINLFQNQ
jgi:Fe-S cluster assembly scaffold protein SufB